MTSFTDSDGLEWQVVHDEATRKIHFKVTDSVWLTDYDGPPVDELSSEQLAALFAAANPGVTVSSVRDYDPDTHPFFDELVGLCVSLSSYLTVLHVQGTNAQGRWSLA